MYQISMHLFVQEIQVSVALLQALNLSGILSLKSRKVIDSVRITFVRCVTRNLIPDTRKVSNSNDQFLI